MYLCNYSIRIIADNGSTCLKPTTFVLYTTHRSENEKTK
jgi:hypothetical protein